MSRGCWPTASNVLSSAHSRQQKTQRPTSLPFSSGPTPRAMAPGSIFLRHGPLQRGSYRAVIRRALVPVTLSLYRNPRSSHTRGRCRLAAFSSLTLRNGEGSFSRVIVSPFGTCPAYSEHPALVGD